MSIVDTHTHAGLNWFEPVELLVHQMNLNQVEKAVLIQHGRPQTGGYDHEYLFECVERFPGRFAVVVIVDVTRADAVERLEKYAARGGRGHPPESNAAFSRARPTGHLEQGRRAWAGGEQHGTSR